MKGFMVFILLVMIGFGIYLGVFMNDLYNGKETFRTEEEYTLFKETISSPDIDIINMQSLSSKPPIIVNFTIRTPSDNLFPYGKKDGVRQPGGYVVALVGFAGLLFVLIYNPKQVDG